jgi:ubiquinone biosynthesis protein
LLRTVRAQWLIWSILAAYGVAWLFGRAVGAERRTRWFEGLHTWSARRLARGFTRLAGVYIKLGQVLSVIATFLPRAYAEELERLQDQVKPRPFSEIRGRLVEALGPDALDRFAAFDPVPVAAASLAQVHRAHLPGGREVAVKILYPGIEGTIRSDLRVLRSVMPVLRRLIPVGHLERVVEQIESLLAHETDYAHERENLERVRAQFAADPEVVVPEVVEELSRGSVIVMSFERGVRITDRPALLRAGIDPTAVARLLVRVYVSMLMEHRVFHADPHPGNFLVRPGPTLVVLDYGAVESVSPELTEGLKCVALGLTTKQDGLVVDGLKRMGFLAADGNHALVAEVAREYLSVLGDTRIEDYGRLDAQAIEQLVGLRQLRGRLRAVMRSVTYPHGFFYVERAMLLLFGLVAQLAPDQGLPGLVLPYATQALARRRARSVPPSSRASVAPSRPPSTPSGSPPPAA